MLFIMFLCDLRDLTDVEDFIKMHITQKYADRYSSSRIMIVKKMLEVLVHLVIKTPQHSKLLPHD